MDAGTMKGPPRPPSEPADPVELLKEWPELGVFGADWLRRWAPYARERIAGMARRADTPGWLSDRAGAAGLVGPCSVEAYAGGSEARIPFSGIYCSADGSSVRRLELEFKRLGPYEDGMTGPTDPRPAGGR